MARTTAPAQTADQIAALLAQTIEAAKTREAMTPKPRNAGPKKLRTYFDTEKILATAKTLPADADWLALTDALGFDDDDELNGPKLRTRLSQLCNTGRLPEHFRPIAPGAKPLYLAQRAEATLRAKLHDLGMTDDQIDAAIAEASQSAS